jgi:hypothetical protein
MVSGGRPLPNAARTSAATPRASPSGPPARKMRRAGSSDSVVQSMVGACDDSVQRFSRIVATSPIASSSPSTGANSEDPASKGSSTTSPEPPASRARPCNASSQERSSASRPRMPDAVISYADKPSSNASHGLRRKARDKTNPPPRGSMRFFEASKTSARRMTSPRSAASDPSA